MERCAPDGTPLPLVERDFHIATACAPSFTMVLSWLQSCQTGGESTRRGWRCFGTWSAPPPSVLSISPRRLERPEPLQDPRPKLTERPLSDPPDAETLRDFWETDLVIEDSAETGTRARAEPQLAPAMHGATVPIIESRPGRPRSGLTCTARPLTPAARLAPLVAQYRADEPAPAGACASLSAAATPSFARATSPTQAAAAIRASSSRYAIASAKRLLLLARPLNDLALPCTHI